MNIEKTDFYRALDCVPIVSTFKNIGDLAVLFRDRKPELEPASPPKSYTAYVKTKNVGWCVLLLIPIIGNLLFFFCGPKKTKKVGSEPESLKTYPPLPWPNSNLELYLNPEAYNLDFEISFDPNSNYKGCYKKTREEATHVAAELAYMQDPEMRRAVMVQFIDNRKDRLARKACKYVGLALRDGGTAAVEAYQEFLQLLTDRKESTMVDEIENRLITEDDLQP